MSRGQGRLQVVGGSTQPSDRVLADRLHRAGQRQCGDLAVARGEGGDGVPEALASVYDTVDE
ncbi:hypothetical protein [Rhodococcus pyridinivorans]|uniref:hypothetical protein n=1 Tax=Rhodococcus pyridinivorans TaxID=103816 RepID=UPI000587153D|nr:hypothetical protein [Rhodococcus pyridinivorans]